MKKNKNIWYHPALDRWYITTWYESKRGGKRRFLRERQLQDGERR